MKWQWASPEPHGSGLEVDPIQERVKLVAQCGPYQPLTFHLRPEQAIALAIELVRCAHFIDPSTNTQSIKDARRELNLAGYNEDPLP